MDLDADVWDWGTGRPAAPDPPRQEGPADCRRSALTALPRGEGCMPPRKGGAPAMARARWMPR